MHMIPFGSPYKTDKLGQVAGATNQEHRRELPRIWARQDHNKRTAAAAAAFYFAKSR